MATATTPATTQAPPATGITPPAESSTPILGTPPAPAATPGSAPETTPVTPSAVTPPAPLKLTLAKGTDEKVAASYVEIATKHGLSQEAAQSIYDFEVGRQEAARKDFLSKVEAEQARLKAAVMADPELKGSKPEDFGANIALANKAVEKFGGSDLRKLLTETGLGDHPVVVRLFCRIGKTMAEDTIAGSSNGSSPSGSDESFLRQLYSNSPSMFQKKD